MLVSEIRCAHRLSSLSSIVVVRKKVGRATEKESQKSRDLAWGQPIPTPSCCFLEYHFVVSQNQQNYFLGIYTIYSTATHQTIIEYCINTDTQGSLQRTVTMSFQDRAQHQIGQIDKEVCQSHAGTRGTVLRIAHSRTSGLLIRLSPRWTMLTSGVIAFQVSYAQQFGEADIRSQSICLPRASRSLLLPHLLQHRWRVPREHCRLHCTRILFYRGSVQRGKDRRHPSK